MSCHQIKRLFATVSHQADADEIERLRGHLADGCTVCQRDVNQLKKVLLATERPALIEPPTWLKNQATNLFVWKKLVTSGQDIKRVLALLLVDSATAGTQMGFRSASSMSRQMLYQAGDYTINLSLSSFGSTPTVDIMGQSTMQNGNLKDLADLDVTLFKDAHIVCPTRSNEFGAFIFNGIPEGIYDLRIQLAHEELDIVGLHVSVHPQA